LEQVPLKVSYWPQLVIGLLMTLGSSPYILAPRLGIYLLTLKKKL
jgi:hypothetical protein